MGAAIMRILLVRVARLCTSRICSLTLVAYARGKMLSSTSSLPWPDVSTKSCHEAYNTI